MISRRQFGAYNVLAGLFLLATACQGVPDGSDSSASLSQNLPNAQHTPTGACVQAEPDDVLIAQLVKDSWVAGYSLTKLFVGADSNITGTDLPDLVKSNLDIINTVPAAKAGVTAALKTVSGLPPYQPDGIGPEQPACETVPAWTPTGTAKISTTEFEVFTTGENEDSWRKTHKAFSKVCPLLRRTGDQDVLDPPGDGSTNLPPSSTVSATGVKANAYGFCPAGTAAGTFCKLSYATGVNYMGRKCQMYYGYMRCLLY